MVGHAEVVVGVVAAAAWATIAAATTTDFEEAGLVCYEEWGTPTESRNIVCRAIHSLAMPPLLPTEPVEPATAARSAFVRSSDDAQSKSIVMWSGDREIASLTLVGLLPRDHSRAMLCHVRVGAGVAEGRDDSGVGAARSRFVVCAAVGLGSFGFRRGPDLHLFSRGEDVAVDHFALVSSSRINDYAAAFICVSSLSTGVSCVSVIENNFSLRHSDPLQLVPSATRSLVVVPIGHTDEDKLAVCYEDIAHTKRPNVAVLRCEVVVAAIDAGLSATALAPQGETLLVRPPAGNGFIIPELIDPDSSDPKAVQSVSYSVIAAPTGKDKIILCYAIVASCPGCRSHICELLGHGEGLAMFKERPHITNGRNVAHHALASIDSFRAVLCYNVLNLETVRQQTKCQLLKALGETLFSSELLEAGTWTLSSLSMAPLTTRSVALCQKPASVYLMGECAVVRFARHKLNFQDSLLMDASVAAGTKRTNSLVVARFDIETHVKSSDIQHTDDDAYYSGAGKGDFVFDTGSPVLIIAAIIFICVTLRCLYRFCWICAHRCGIDLPNPPEVTDVAQKMIEQTPRLFGQKDEKQSKEKLSRDKHALDRVEKYHQVNFSVTSYMMRAQKVKPPIFDEVDKNSEANESDLEAAEPFTTLASVGIGEDADAHASDSLVVSLGDGQLTSNPNSGSAEATEEKNDDEDKQPQTSLVADEDDETDPEDESGENCQSSTDGSHSEAESVDAT
eukprot:TRINITY_DN11111_c1_g3_i1.p1 TRINITY_DN11111_c1_g3~~TRINITY_DN11111_c1_g3_i1.p1  ORF type:complete len:734 (+),score=108.34 TRINITY_DN11111_c1_g3_i1:118-2319(+)